MENIYKLGDVVNILDNKRVPFMKLSEICNYSSKRIDSTHLGTGNYISTENMLQNKGGVVNAARVPKENAVEFLPGDILISNIRPYFKKIWHADRIGGCSSDVLCIRAKLGVDNSFLFYLLSQDKFFDYVMSGIKGCKMPRGDKNQIMNWNIAIPKLEEQKRIGSFLKYLDSKIELNNRINHNLEEQAQALYKSWFVDFEPFKDGKFVESELGLIPEGWRVVTMGEVTTEIRTKVGNRTEIKVLSPINTGKLALSEEYFTKQVFSNSIAKYILVEPNSFAYNPARVNIGSIGMNEFPFAGCVSPVYVVFRCEDEYEYLFDFFRKGERFKTEVITRSIGGVRQTLAYKDFSMIKMVYPPAHIIRNFNSIYHTFYRKINDLENQNKKTSELRDSILPKLMSGELKINEIDC